MVATSFWSPDGTPISAAQFIERMFGDLPEFFKDEDELRGIWVQPDTRKALLSVAYDTLCRRSELVAADVEHLAIGDDGSGSLYLLLWVVTL